MKARHATWARHAIALLVLGGAVLAIAACGGGDNGDATASGNGSDSGSITAQTVDGMDVLVDSKGQVLYTNEQERGGKIVCTGDCTAIWAPVAASGSEPSGSSVGGDVGTVKRPDGTEQVTFDGSPVYTFTEEGPGELTGDGVKDNFNGTKFSWQVVTASGGAAAPSTAAPSTTTSSSGGGSGYSY
jgi:predicted lipoprotein with Yx(FWY)xxD motif